MLELRETPSNKITRNKGIIKNVPLLKGSIKISTKIRETFKVFSRSKHSQRAYKLTNEKHIKA